MRFIELLKVLSKLTSRGILNYMWSANLSKSFSQLINYGNIDLSSVFFSVDFARWKCVSLP